MTKEEQDRIIQLKGWFIIVGSVLAFLCVSHFFGIWIALTALAVLLLLIALSAGDL